MSEITSSTEKNSSINLSRTSKGVYSWDIKIYFDNKDDEADKTIAKIKTLNTRMQTEFKSESG